MLDLEVTESNIKGRMRGNDIVARGVCGVCVFVCVCRALLIHTGPLIPGWVRVKPPSSPNFTFFKIHCWALGIP